MIWLSRSKLNEADKNEAKKMFEIAEHHPYEELRRLVEYNPVVDAARIKRLRDQLVTI